MRDEHNNIIGYWKSNGLLCRFGNGNLKIYAEGFNADKKEIDTFVRLSPDIYDLLLELHEKLKENKDV